MTFNVDWLLRVRETEFTDDLIIINEVNRQACEGLIELIDDSNDLYVSMYFF